MCFESIKIIINYKINFFNLCIEMDDTFVSILMMKAVDRVCQSHGKHSPPKLINVVFSLRKRK